MFTLYVLKSLGYNRHYIGITENIDNRLMKHNNGGVKSTKPYKPWRLVYTKEFADKTEARKREIHLKKNARARVDLFQSIE